MTSARSRWTHYFESWIEAHLNLAAMLVLAAARNYRAFTYNAGQLKIGNARMRFFVAAKIALHKAGASGGTGGSPAPVGASVLETE